MYKIPIYFLKEILSILDLTEKALKGELKIKTRLSLLTKVKRAKKTIKLLIGE